MEGNETIDIRVKPHNDEAERSVIGSMLMDRNVISEVSAILSREDFYNTEYGIYFENMVELYNEGTAVDIITLTERLKLKNLPEEYRSVKYISTIVSEVVSTAHAVAHARIIRDASLMRRLISLSDGISKECYDMDERAESILEKAEASIFELAQGRDGSGAFVPINRIVVDVIEEIEKASQNQGRINGLPTGFTDLDNMLTGLHSDELILVAARPSMGKTAFVLNIAHHVAVGQNIPVVIFSLEMSKEQLVTRLVAVDSMVDAQAIKTGDLQDEDWAKIIESGELVAKAPIFIDDNSGITVSELRSKCRKLKQQHDIGLVIIDYLQLMNSSKAVESRQQFISDVSRSLKGLARELGIPVIALSQLNRAVDARNDHRPVLADLRESGAIEQDADVVMFIYRDEYYNKETEKPGIAEIIIAKQRNGSTGTIDLVWLGKYTKFSNKEH